METPRTPPVPDFVLSVPLAPPLAGPVGTPPAPAEAAPEPRGLSANGRFFGMMEWLLKHRDYLLDQIEQGREVAVILVDLLLVAVLPAMFYGLVVGLATNSLARILSNPIKLPLVLVFTLCLCLPTLYIFSCFLGSRRTFLQTAALGFTALAILGVILAAFSPITWFLTFTSPGSHNLHVLVNVAVLGFGGVVGIKFLLYGFRRAQEGKPGFQSQLWFLYSWIVLYGLVGAQMGWLLRPFFSESSEWLRPRLPGDDNVFTALWRVLQHPF